MAVQKSRKTPSTRGMRRSHDALKAPTLSVEPTTGETHLRHHVSPEGYYKGRKVTDQKVVELSDE
jgi:large subunit ribosomal protein L32